MSAFDVDDLRRILAEEAAENSPESLGMVASVVAAAPVRRRRRAALAAGAALAVTAAITVPLVLVDGTDRPTRHEPSAPTAPPPPRAPVVLAATVAPGSGFAMAEDEDGFVGTTQRFRIRTEPDSGYSGSVLSVFAPGTFDPTPYTSGERVTVQGQPGYFSAQFPYQIPATPGTDIVDKPDDPAGDGLVTLYDMRVAWQDPSGYWLVLTQDSYYYGRDMALRAAQAVRMAPHPVKVPVAFTDLPNGMRLEVAVLGRTIRLTYVSGGPPTHLINRDVINAEGGATADGFALILEHRPSPAWGVAPGESLVRIGEADVKYAEQGANPGLADNYGPGQSGFTVLTETCGGTLLVKDRQKFPRAAAEAFIASIDFKDCADPSTWVALER